MVSLYKQMIQSLILKCCPVSVCLYTIDPWLPGAFHGHHRPPIPSSRPLMLQFYYLGNSTVPTPSSPTPKFYFISPIINMVVVTTPLMPITAVNHLELPQVAINFLLVVSIFAKLCFI